VNASTSTAVYLRDNQILAPCMKSTNRTTEELIRWLRDYASERVDSRWIDERKCIPPHVILDFGNRGLFGMTTPSTHGGLGLSHRDTFAVFEQLGFIDLCLATHTANVTLAARTIEANACAAVAARHVRRLAEGRSIAAFALTEPTAGSDLGALAASAIRTKAGRWVLDGEKRWIGGGAWAELISVFCIAKGVDGTLIGPTCFLVERGPGVIVKNEADTLGMLGMVQSTLVFEKVELEDRDVLGSLGGGLQVAQRAMMFNRLCLSAIALGGVQRCLQLIDNYTGQRRVAIGRLSESLVVRSLRNDLIASAMILNRALEETAGLLDRGVEIPDELICSLKVFSSEALGAAADAAVQLLGGRGYDESNGAAKILRDARAFRIFEGPSETLRTFVGARLEHAPERVVQFLTELGAGSVVEQIGKDRAVALQAQSRRIAAWPASDRVYQDWYAWCLGDLAVPTLMLALARAPRDADSLPPEAESWLRWRHALRCQELASAFDQPVWIEPAAADGFARDVQARLGSGVQCIVRPRAAVDELVLRPAGAVVTQSTATVQRATVTETPSRELPENLDDAASARAIERSNRTERAFRYRGRLEGLVAESVSAHPDATAVVCGEVRLSYAELWDAAGRLAGALAERGTLREARHVVALVLERGIELAVAMLATLRAGLTYLPIDPALPLERVHFMLRDANPVAVISNRTQRSRHDLDGSRYSMIDVDTLERRDPEDVAPNAGSDLAYLIYTSGSTGAPKGALLPHAGVVNWLLWLEATFNFDATDAVMWKANVGFDHSVWECFLPWIVGGKLVIIEPGREADAGHLVHCIRQHAVSVAQFVPSMLRLFLDDPSVASCESLRFVMAGGEALPPALIEQFYARLPDGFLCNCYGPTEASIGATMWPCPRGQHLASVPIGKPIANMRIHILDDRLVPVPHGTAGEICIEGSLARGYLNRPDLTQERFVLLSGPSPVRVYRTGDRGAWRADGNLDYLGRIDNQVKIRGMRVELEEVESAMNAHPEIAQSCASTDLDRYGNSRLLCFYKRRANDGAARPQLAQPDLHRFLHRSLPEYMIPARFIEVADFRYTSNGKIDRAALAATNTKAAAGPPSDTVSRDTLVRLWQEVLESGDLDPTATFLELGGNSLLLLRLLSLLELNFGRVVARQLRATSSINDILEAVQHQASALATETAGDAAPLVT